MDLTREATARPLRIPGLRPGMVSDDETPEYVEKEDDHSQPTDDQTSDDDDGEVDCEEVH